MIVKPITLIRALLQRHAKRQAQRILAMPNGGYVCQVCYNTWVMQQAALTHRCAGVPVRKPLLLRRIEYSRLERWLRRVK